MTVASCEVEAVAMSIAVCAFANVKLPNIDSTISKIFFILRNISFATQGTTDFRTAY
jgi:hypothetical protein